MEIPTARNTRVLNKKLDISVKNIAKKKSKVEERNFEELYNAVRQLEKKVYSDEQLRALPNFDYSHEWEIRKRSSGRLLSYLLKKNKHLTTLEIGCGNGWLSAKLAAIPNTQVTGLDINHTEIDQANRVFKKDNLQFINNSFNENLFENEKFDVIIFAASVQYFSSIKSVLTQAIDIINPDGEIHIIDTPFYNHLEVDKAAERCRNYYMDMGIAEMANHYFHHCINNVLAFKHKILFNPENITNRLFKKDPFYWIAINK